MSSCLKMLVQIVHFLAVIVLEEQRVHAENDEWSNNWWKDVIKVVTRDRVVDKILEDRIDKIAFMCVKNTFQKNSF